ncbi:MAG: hypothetical protein FJ125_13740 [Deltaproteobacteria bacterium]|nr:hypothetical protein [Deltaproteobacteria bacterium]
MGASFQCRCSGLSQGRNSSRLRRLLFRAMAYLVLLLPWAAANPGAAQPVPSFVGGEEQLARSGLHFHFLAEDRLAAEELARSGGRARAAIAADLGRDDGRVYQIWLAHDRAAFAELLGGAPEWMAGVAFGGAGWAVIRLDPRGEAPWREVEETFRHELAHLMLRQATGEQAEVPRWFSEGFAIYQAREWSFERARTLTRAILRGRVLRLEEISASFPVEPEQVQLAYAQSVAFTGYLLKQGQGGEFARLLAGLSAGQVFPQAIEEAFGRSLQELEEEWQGQLERDYAWVPLLLGGSTLWVLVTILFLLAYLSHRRRRRRTLARLAAADAAAADEVDEDEVGRTEGKGNNGDAHGAAWSIRFAEQRGPGTIRGDGETPS